MTRASKATDRPSHTAAGAGKGEASETTVPRLTVAVTGPTGTFGSGFIPLLQADERIGSIVGVARRPFDPESRGWTKMTYQRGDVRDPATLRSAFDSADVVVHLAFQITGAGTHDDIRRTNLDGTRNVVEAAVATGVKRLVYASSVAAYGFHPDNPVGMREDWPVRPARSLFYARQKAELDAELQQLQLEHPQLDVYLLRPSIVVGPNAVGAKLQLPSGLAPLAKGADVLTRGARALRLPVPAPRHPVQLVHEDDVGQALLQCTIGAGPPGAYNIAGDGSLTIEDVLRELGYTTVPVPGALTRWASRAASEILRPAFVPPALTWVEAASHPSIMDTSKAKDELGWRPRYDSREALRASLRRS